MPDQKDQMTIFLAGKRGIFAADMSELGETPLTTHHIDTGDALPIKQRPYRTAPALSAEIERQVNDMLRHDVIRPSTSPWSFPVVLVKKKVGTYSFAVDYRKLNKVSNPYTSPFLVWRMHSTSWVSPLSFPLSTSSQGSGRFPWTENHRTNPPSPLTSASSRPGRE